MRVLLINAVCGIRSTGRICTDLATMYHKLGHEAIVAYGREHVPNQYINDSIRIGNLVDVYWHAFMSKAIDDRGLWSKRATIKFVEWANRYDPDILWLHNLHDYFINYEILFSWIKTRPKMKVKWTQHDCWSFTGGCTHFSYIKCEEWKNGCRKCPLKNNFFLGQKHRNFQLKKRSFTGVNQMTIITPSKWLSELVKESFLGNNNIMVINNTIDKSVFKPTKSKFRELYNLENNKIVLGVASQWTERKGLQDLIELSRLLPDEYKIVIVGLDEKQLKTMPHNIIGLKKTNSVKDLAGLYSTSDVYVNTTYEDTYPTTNLEAQACGTPVLTYRTGGSVESVPVINICNQGDIRQLCNKIITKEYENALELDNDFHKEYLF